MKVLVVITEFADYVKGQVIRGYDEVKDILEGHNASHVVVADHPAETVPAPTASPSAD